MCLIVFALDRHPEFQLVLAANRDEFYERPSAPAAFWDDASQVLGGRDLARGGSWFGVTRGGKWCAVTNFRDGRQVAQAGPSRGSLVQRYLTQDHDALAFASSAEESLAGYNLLMGEGRAAHYSSNRGAQVRRLSPGVYGLSNHLLDSAWPKVVHGKNALGRLLDRPGTLHPETVFQILADRTLAADAELPDTGVAQEVERMLSPAFIRSPNYGTRCSTVLLIRRDGQIFFEERSFGADDDAMPLRRFQFKSATAARASTSSDA